jgi:hypothetical protein
MGPLWLVCRAGIILPGDGGLTMKKEVCNRVAEAANGSGTINSQELAAALIDLRVALDGLGGNYGRCQDSLHYIDKQLAKVSAACRVTYCRVTAELVGE